MVPPFKPKLSSETDTSNFDPEFTNAPMTGSLNARAAALASVNMPASTPLSPGMQANFRGFTFVDESSIDDHFDGGGGGGSGSGSGGRGGDDDGDLEPMDEDLDERWDDDRHCQGHQQQGSGSSFDGSTSSSSGNSRNNGSKNGNHHRMSGVLRTGDDEGGVFGSGGMEI